LVWLGWPYGSELIGGIRSKNYATGIAIPIALACIAERGLGNRRSESIHLKLLRSTRASNKKFNPEGVRR
jgi:hypothetical protein